MTQSEAPQDIREIIAGRPGAVNRFLRRFGKPILDYATALIPDRSEPFDRLVEDIMVDAIAQCRTAVRLKEDEQVFEYVMEVAMRTVRARYRQVLEGEARPSKATRSYNFKEVLEKTRMTEAELTAGISEGKFRAVRDNDMLKFSSDSIPGLGERTAHQTYHVTAAERELLCMHYRLHFSPETIARWSGATAAQVEATIAKAANRLTKAIAKREARGGDGAKDTEMRRYIDGRMKGDETAKFERSVLKDKIAQQRLDELRSQADSFRELFDSGPYELSSIAVNVRTRNPHHAMALPPVAALWLQVVGIAALLLMFHNVGAYLPPPEAQVTALVGETTLPPTLSRDGEEHPDVLERGESRRLLVGDWIQTPAESQALVVLDKSNRVLLAPNSKVTLLEPRPDARQVLLLEGESGAEIWGRFTASGHAFAVQFGTPETPEGEVASDIGAEFHLALHPGPELLPDNLADQLVRAVAMSFEPDETSGLRATRPLKGYAGFRFGDTSDGLNAGDIIESIEGLTLTAPEDIAEIAARMDPGETHAISVRRGNERLALSLQRMDKQPWAVVRVFHGALVAGAPGTPAAARSLVNTGQWAAFFTDEPPVVGLRGLENFRLLRIGTNERFKQHLHWLNTERYPLRAENSVLAVERELRALAARLEKLRADTIQRGGQREIAEFETIMRAAIADARARIERDEGREKGAGSESLSDESLVAAEAEILSIIGNWKRRSTSGIYTVLGDAAKTLTPEILRLEAELESRGSQLTTSILRQQEIEDLNDSIAIQDEAIAKLKESEFFDAEGDKRAAIDKQITELDADVREAANARGRRDVILVRLNDLDAKIDAQRRRVAGLTQAVTDARDALSETEDMLKANIYTPESLTQAQADVEAARHNLETARAQLAKTEEAVLRKEEALVPLVSALGQARETQAAAELQKDAAADALTDAVADRAAAQSGVDEAQKEVDRISAELEEMEEEDPDREAKQEELNAATAALETAQATLTTAAEAADDANTALKAAEADLAQAQAASDKAEQARKDADDALTQAKADKTDAEAQLATRQKAAEDAEATLKAQEDAKTARALLETRQEEQQQELQTATEKLDDVNATIAKLEEQAEPEREKLATELALMAKGEAATETIRELRRERGRHQGISDEITRRGNDRAALVEQRDTLENSDLVRNYDTLREEYRQVSARIDTFKFVRARGLLEDNNFAYAQDAALHAFKEAAEDAEARAVEVLRQFSPAYNHEEYAQRFEGEEGQELYEAVLTSLWKLYYDAGMTGTADSSALNETRQICYYVAVHSGADSRTLESLDNSWRAYLTSALGGRGFEAIAMLEPAQAGQRKE